MVRLVAYNNIVAPGNAELDVDYWRDGPRLVFGTLVDPYPTGNQSVIEPLQVGDPGPDFLLGAVGTLDVMKRNFERNLHSWALHTFGVFGVSFNALRDRIVSAQSRSGRCRLGIGGSQEELAAKWCSGTSTRPYLQLSAWCFQPAGPERLIRLFRNGCKGFGRRHKRLGSRARRLKPQRMVLSLTSRFLILTCRGVKALQRADRPNLCKRLPTTSKKQTAPIWPSRQRSSPQSTAARSRPSSRSSECPATCCSQSGDARRRSAVT